MIHPSALRPTGPVLDKPALFQVGSAQKIITPPLGTAIGGFFHLRIGTYTRDELYARAMTIQSQDRTIALVSLDLISVDSLFVDKAKQIIHEECGIPADHVSISATHTHAGPEVRQVGNKVPRNEAWLATLPRMVADVVKDALASATTCTLHAGNAQAEGYVFNRLYRMSNGREVMGRSKADSPILGPAGPVDATLSTLSAVDQHGQLRSVIVNLGLHPVTVSGGSADFFSADWPGAMCRHLSMFYGNGVIPIFLQSACGDINHTPYDPTNLPTAGSAKCEQLGRGLAGLAIFALERAEPITDGTLRSIVQTIDIPYYTRTPQIMAQVEEMKKKENRTAMDDFFITAVETWPFDGQVSKVPLMAIRLGPLALVSVPAQVFTQIGLEIKKWSPAAQTMVIELANARVTSYVPTTDQVERGAYGSHPVISRWLSPDAGRLMADAFLVMLHQLWQPAAQA